MQNILITGGAGFIGSNFVPYFAKKYPDCHIVNMDALTYAGDLENLADLNGAKNHEFVLENICDKIAVDYIFDEYKIDTVVHFAAESHVDNSIKNPRAFIDTNIVGTFNLLDAARRAGALFHHISTDEVFGELGAEGCFAEPPPYNPSSPYSASKASSDMLARSWHRTYGLRVTISNCSNNYGPKQHSEKLIPTIIGKCAANEKIPVYGDGTNVRDWLYVKDHCRAIDLILHKGKIGETYNIGGGGEMSNLEVVRKICQAMDRDPDKLIEFVKDRPGHDRRYAIDSSKIRRELGWRAKETFDTGIIKTIGWYLQKIK